MLRIIAVWIVEMYTATEAAAVTLCNGGEWLQRPGTVGRCVIGEMAIFDADEDLGQRASVRVRCTMDRDGDTVAR
jgi:hypothetical protein